MDEHFTLVSPCHSEKNAGISSLIIQFSKRLNENYETLLN